MAKSGLLLATVLLVLLAACSPKEVETDSMRFTKVKLQEVARIAEKGNKLLSPQVIQSPEYHYQTLFKAQDIHAEAVKVMTKANIYDANVPAFNALEENLMTVRIALTHQTFGHLETALRKASVLIDDWYENTPSRIRKSDVADQNELMRTIEKSTSNCCLNLINANFAVLEKDKDKFGRVINFTLKFNHFVKQMILQQKTLDDLLRMVTEESAVFENAIAKHIK